MLDFPLQSASLSIPSSSAHLFLPLSPCYAGPCTRSWGVGGIGDGSISGHSLNSLFVTDLINSFLCFLAPGASVLCGDWAVLSWGGSIGNWGSGYTLCVRRPVASLPALGVSCTLRSTWPCQSLSPSGVFCRFTVLPSSRCSFTGMEALLSLVIYCFFVPFWTVWAFTCLVVLVKIGLVFLFLLIVRLWLILRGKGDSPCLAPSGLFFPFWYIAGSCSLTK